jgi:UPF0271 protein
MKRDLNCDLGEGEPAARTRALMRWITSANVATGGHAGNVSTMISCVRLARQFGVRLGAHPGPWSQGDFGRAAADLPPGALTLLLLHQVGALATIAQAEAVPLRHVKLHGALYHATEENDGLAWEYLQAIRAYWPRLIVYARAGGRVAALAPRFHVKLWPEVFADRGYRDDGTLIPRNEHGALLDNPLEVQERIRSLRADGTFKAASGKVLKLGGRTICVHGDAEHASRFARLAARELMGELRGPTRGGAGT